MWIFVFILNIFNISYLIISSEEYITDFYVLEIFTYTKLHIHYSDII